MLDPKVAAIRHAENKRICEALRFAGGRVSSIFDLVSTRAAYPELIPALLEILPTVSEPWIREGVVRALTVKEARGTAGPALIREFRTSDPLKSDGWAVGNALSVVATSEMFEEIAELLLTRTHGRARQMLPAALVRADKQRAEAVLLTLLDDNDVLPHVVRELGKLKAKAAVPRLRELLSSEWTLLRTESKKALARIGSV